MDKKQDNPVGVIPGVPSERRLLGTLLIYFPIYILLDVISIISLIKSADIFVNNEAIPEPTFLSGIFVYLVWTGVICGVIFGIYFLVKKVPMKKNEYDSGSGEGEESRKLAKYRKWNWGAFFMPIAWGLMHHRWIALLAFLPPLGLIFSVYFAVDGYRIAWKSIKWRTEAEYLSFQRGWSIFSSLFFIATVASTIAMIVIFQNVRMENYVREKLVTPAFSDLKDHSRYDRENPDVSWKEYGSPNGHFRFAFPVRPSFSDTINIDDDGYQFQQITFFDPDWFYFLMGMSSYHPEDVRFNVMMPAERRLAAALDRYFMEEEGVTTTHRYRQMTTHYGYPAMDYVVDRGPSTVYGRVIVWGSWIYILGINSELGGEKDPNLDRFIDGFKPFPLIPTEQLREELTVK
ncbi:hypothetical protein M0Q28_02685 [Patescibacteria group bacterium]|nr:hypothetical protein [Patescibacteria group bacterium]